MDLIAPNSLCSLSGRIRHAHITVTIPAKRNACRCRVVSYIPNLTHHKSREFELIQISSKKKAADRDLFPAFTNISNQNSTKKSGNDWNKA